MAAARSSARRVASIASRSSSSTASVAYAARPSSSASSGREEGRGEEFVMFVVQARPTSWTQYGSSQLFGPGGAPGSPDSERFSRLSTPESPDRELLDPHLGADGGDGSVH